MGTLQIRIDDRTKMKAAAVYAELGVDLSTAIRMFLMKSIEAGGFPFNCFIENNDSKKEVLETLDKIRTRSEQNGNSNMTLDEINQIIVEVRRERNEKRN